MTKQLRADSSEGSSSSPQIPTRKITDAEVQHVAAVGDIPEEQLSQFTTWLRYAVDRYYEFARNYDSCLPKKQKLKSIGEINVAAQKLNILLKQPWPKAAMMSHEAISLLSRKEDLSDNRSAAIKEQVERDLSGVEALENRTAAMHKRLESRAENEDEKIAATGAAKPEIEILHNLMRTYWRRLGRKPTFAEESPYVRFARAVYGLVRLSEEAPVGTIISRHKAAQR